MIKKEDSIDNSERNRYVDTKNSSPDKTFLTNPGRSEGTSPFTLHDMLFPAGKVAKLVILNEKVQLTF